MFSLYKESVVMFIYKFLKILEFIALYFWESNNLKNTLLKSTKQAVLKIFHGIET